ncbi:DNA replication complex GINS protein PSF1-like [Paramacrobiotus metropolitanus]|uniref:DNA replication complex GINS protein PSF1-like n=1 Tax=Paramacrobiotus metropolitanus TaxID=2943436 RepID=UPI00244653BF|nr:DNA replication complex GINS protein PSF1-like [Paramacrobiotus metropolitanus]
MFCRRAEDLIRSLARAPDETIPPYNAEAVRLICEEIATIHENNVEDSGRRESLLAASQDKAAEDLKNAISFRHLAKERNLRCLIAYHYNRLERLRNLRWSFGGILPRDVRAALSEKEVEWFNSYNTLLTGFMQDNSGLNLPAHQKPPQDLYIHVRVLKDFGEYQLEDGSCIQLTKNTRHVLPLMECEDLIRQGILEHVVN